MESSDTRAAQTAQEGFSPVAGIKLMERLKTDGSQIVIVQRFQSRCRD